MYWLALALSVSKSIWDIFDGLRSDIELYVKLVEKRRQ